MELRYIVKDNSQYKNINQILEKEFDFSTRLLAKLIKNKQILLNGFSVDTRNEISINDEIIVKLDLEEDNSNIVPTKMNIEIIYEDEWFLVINKPAGIAIHPSRMHYTDSLSNGIRYYFDKIGLKKKVRPVNRLDFDTSGIVIFAKCEYIQECFIKQMNNKTFKKEYLAIVNGILENKKGSISFPIARKEGSIIERCVSDIGQPSVTHYEVLSTFENYSLVKCYLETGRTHQIRVHFAAISHPLIGDTLYGNPSDLISRQALHSYKISCIHPIFNKKVEFICDIPLDMKKLI